MSDFSRGSCPKHGTWPAFEARCIECGADAMPQDDLVCPFCSIDGFDQPGLKAHLLRGQCSRLERVDEIR